MYYKCALVITDISLFEGYTLTDHETYRNYPFKDLL